MNQVNVINHTGKIVGTLPLPQEVFGQVVNKKLIAQAIRVYQVNQSQQSKKVKTRGEVNRTTAKVWRQKGTGRARHGARSAPIFVGGGVAHGPTGAISQRLKLTRQMRRQALLGSLNLKATAGMITVIEDLEKLPPKTSAVATLMSKVFENKPKTKVLIIADKVYENWVRATSNLQRINLTQAKRMNTLEILSHTNLIFAKDSLDLIKNLYALPSHTEKTTPTSLATKTKTSQKTAKTTKTPLKKSATSPAKLPTKKAVKGKQS